MIAWVREMVHQPSMFNIEPVDRLTPREYFATHITTKRILSGLKLGVKQGIPTLNAMNQYFSSH